jgi:UDP-N-acetylglucosamine 4-epimerase
VNEVFNVACHQQTTLNELFAVLRHGLVEENPRIATLRPKFKPARVGDVRHSSAAIDKSVRLLGYAPTHSFQQGLAQALRET